MYFININIIQHVFKSELEDEKASMLLFYIDGIYWTKFHSFISANKENLGCRFFHKLGGWEILRNAEGQGIFVMGGMIQNLEGEWVDTPLRTLMQLESRETYISPLEICKKNEQKKFLN